VIRSLKCGNIASLRAFLLWHNEIDIEDFLRSAFLLWHNEIDIEDILRSAFLLWHNEIGIVGVFQVGCVGLTL
jgi:hypothetical protein